MGEIVISSTRGGGEIDLVAENGRLAARVAELEQQLAEAHAVIEAVRRAACRLTTYNPDGVLREIRAALADSSRIDLERCRHARTEVVDGHKSSDPTRFVPVRTETLCCLDCGATIYKTTPLGQKGRQDEGEKRQGKVQAVPVVHRD